MGENVKLGIGDPRKFNLLGGTFGEAGDTSLAAIGAGRFFRDSKSKILQGTTSSGALSERDRRDRGMHRPGGRR